VASYTCPDRAAAEWRLLFQDCPHLLGFSCELEHPGSYFTSRDLGKPIVCTRDEAGNFRAFLNVCRHRGTIVEHERRGRKKLFTCPFRSWSDNGAGELVAVPKETHFGRVDKSCHGLVELPAAAH